MPDKDRSQRVRRLRDGWRQDQRTDDDSNPSGSEADHELRRSRTLGSTDRIRTEAPDDLETRRMADQVEREIKRLGGEPRGQRPSGYQEIRFNPDGTFAAEDAITLTPDAFTEASPACYRKKLLQGRRACPRGLEPPTFRSAT